MENELETLNSSNEQPLEPIIEEAEVQSDSDTQTEEVDVEALKQTNRELFARAKRAEGFELKDGKWVKKEKPAPKVEAQEVKKEKDLSADDLYALMDARVPREDVNEVKKAASVLGVSISEALNTPLVKTLLKTKMEERATASATATKVTRPSSKANSDDVILDNFQKGEISEKPEDIERLVQAQLNKRIAESKRN